MRYIARVLEWALIIGGLAFAFVVGFLVIPKFVNRRGWPVDPANGRPITDPREVHSGQMVLIRKGSKWYEGTIRRVHDDGRVLVHFNDWDSKYDVDVEQSSLLLR